jgi:superfamily I DNA and/or RNA helicase
MQDPVQDHFERLKKLVELEEAEEIASFREEFLQRTPEEREQAGKALLALSLVDSHYSPAGHRLLTLRYATGKPFPLFSLETGDPVTLSRESMFETEPSFGTVYDKTASEITVAFDRDLPEWIHEGSALQLNLAGNRATFKKIYRALAEAREAEHSRLAYLRNVFLGLRPPADGDPVRPEDLRFFNEGLNPSQQEAVRVALEAPDVALVHGPPGTGKTTVLVEIIRQAAARKKFVFATAPSNTACDHLLECLAAAGLAVIRLGHPARILTHLRQHTLDFKLARHPHAKLIDETEKRIEKLFLRRERYAERRALDRDERTGIREEIRGLRSEIRALEAEIYDGVWNETEVVVGTHAGAADRVFEKRPFDVLVMDEASQATEASSWVPLLKAGKVILAGDHFQLPPTVRSVEAAKSGLGLTLFERLYEILGGRFVTLLDVQYRMNEKIMNFSSRRFYGGKLIADASVRRHTLADLPHVRRGPKSEEVFLFLDTAGCGFEEAVEPGSQSRYNPEEAEWVCRELRDLIDHGVKPAEIAVISAYSAQVRVLRSRIPDEEIEIDSVDGFQGREKEAVIVSLVRSNVEGELGFLADTRRMNVAMTRARRKLVILGDSSTLSALPFYRDLAEYAESIGLGIHLN